MNYHEINLEYLKFCQDKKKDGENIKEVSLFDDTNDNADWIKWLTVMPGLELVIYNKHVEIKGAYTKSGHPELFEYSEIELNKIDKNEVFIENIWTIYSMGYLA